MNITVFQKNIPLRDFRTENIQSEKRRIEFKIPKAVQEPYACPEKAEAYQKGLRENNFSEYRAAWGDPPPPVEHLHYTSPTCQVLILTTQSGEVYRITRKSSSPMRDDCPTAIRGVFRKGVRAKEPTPYEIGIRPNRRRADFIELVFSDGRTEEAILTVSKPPQNVIQSEVERIAAMTIREAVEMLMRTHQDVDSETLQIGIRHMTGQTWTQIQKDMKRSRETVMKRIDAFYAATPYPRPDRVRGKGKRVQFDDNRDTPEHLDTRPTRGKRTNSRTVR